MLHRVGLHAPFHLKSQFPYMVWDWNLDQLKFTWWLRLTYRLGNSAVSVVWSHLLKKSLIENFIFCTVLEEDRGEGKVNPFFPSSNLTQEACMHIDTTCNMLTKFDLRAYRPFPLFNNLKWYNVKGCTRDTPWQMTGDVMDSVIFCAV